MTITLAILLVIALPSLIWLYRQNTVLRARLAEERRTTEFLADRLVCLSRDMDRRIGEGVIEALCARRKRERMRRSPAAQRGWETRRNQFPGAAAPKKSGSASALFAERQGGDAGGNLHRASSDATAPVQFAPAEFSTEGE